MENTLTNKQVTSPTSVNQANEVVKAIKIEMKPPSKLFGYFESTVHLEIKPANELEAIISKRYKLFLGKSK